MKRAPGQATANAYLAQLGARAPFATLTRSGRDVIDADGRIVFHVIPTGNARTDHDLAWALAAIVNAACGADDSALRHDEAVHESTAAFLRRVTPPAPLSDAAE